MLLNIRFTYLSERTFLSMGIETFGITGLPTKKNKKEEAGAVRGRIKFPDVFFGKESLTIEGNHLKALDIKGKANFGSPNPSISNWWYFTPKEIGKRNVHNTRILAEFIGDKLRGRKFYFHQNPKQCIDWYWDNWSKNNNGHSGHLDLDKYDVECIKDDIVSNKFNITFHKIPETLLKLFLKILCPNNTVHHKLGALKPFGFGSIQFNIEKILIEKSGSDKLGSININGGDGIFKEDAELKNWVINNSAGKELLFPDLVNPTSWEWLRFILYCPCELNTKDRLFIYPVFRKDRELSPVEKGFAQTIKYEKEYEDTMKKEGGKKLAEQIYKEKLKLPIDFDIYQNNEDSNFKEIRIQAGLPEDFKHNI